MKRACFTVSFGSWISGQTGEGVEVAAMGKDGDAGTTEGAGGTQAITQAVEATTLAKMTKRTRTLASIMADILLSELSTMIPQILS
jgi:hypothetical protein